MGGQASNLSAANAAAVAELNIGAAVALNPYAKKFSPSLVPVLYAAGSLDLVTPATYIEDMYKQTKGVPAIYAELANGGHTESQPIIGNQRWTPYVVAMF